MGDLVVVFAGLDQVCANDHVILVLGVLGLCIARLAVVVVLPHPSEQDESSTRVRMERPAHRVHVLERLNALAIEDLEGRVDAERGVPKGVKGHFLDRITEFLKADGLAVMGREERDDELLEDGQANLFDPRFEVMGHRDCVCAIHVYILLG
jgi:hypothetical protein